MLRYRPHWSVWTSRRIRLSSTVVLPSIRTATSQWRSIKTSSLFSLADLPQGLVGPVKSVGRSKEEADGSAAATVTPAPRRHRKRASSTRRSTGIATTAKADADGTDGPDIEQSGHHRAGSSDWLGDDNETESTARSLPPLDLDDTIYPTVVQQAKENMKRHPSCVLLTRVGGFYELYFDQAKELSSALGLKLAQKRTTVGPVYMAGFPYFQLDRYLKTLVQGMNKYVAIADEVPLGPADKARAGGLMFDRRISRIISPGTLIDESFMDPWEHNFILTIHADGHDKDGSSTPALAWLDLSSGQFYIQSVPADSVGAAIERINPREIIVDSRLEANPPIWLAGLADERTATVSYFTPPPGGPTPPMGEWQNLVDFVSQPIELKRVDDLAGFADRELTAGFVLVQYVRTRLLDMVPRLHRPVKRQSSDIMLIDRPTVRALELRQTLHERVSKGSLLHSIRRTVTKSGTRLLSQRLAAPSTNPTEIEWRLDLVDDLVAEPVMRENVVHQLRQIADFPRLLQRFAFERGNADNLVELARSIYTTRRIVNLLATHLSKTEPEEHVENDDDSEVVSGRPLRHLVDKIDIDTPARLATAILDAIDEDVLSEATASATGSSDGMETGGIRAGLVSRFVSGQDTTLPTAFAGSDSWIMKRTATPMLENLHQHLDQLHVRRSELEKTLQDAIDRPSLTLRWTPGLGYICHMKNKASGSNSGPVVFPAEFGPTATVNSSKSTRSVAVPAWTELGMTMDSMRAQIRAGEQDVFRMLRSQVVAALPVLQTNSAVLDEIDIGCGFARLATERDLVRPTVVSEPIHSVVAGRHMTVELGLASKGRLFTPNDCQFEAAGVPSLGQDVEEQAGSKDGVESKPSILLVTGPNMAGKSTFLRQNALISILAQAGSYVPAQAATVGIVDKLFARVGSADNLFANQSTFMVEMLETASILSHATEQSLVVMDEVGRGTTPTDGLAIAFATVVHLALTNRARTIFATHFTDMADLVADHPTVAATVSCLCTDIVESDDGLSWAFVHRMRPGVSSGSHALKVAKMAGIPDQTLQLAAATLERLEQRKQASV